MAAGVVAGLVAAGGWGAAALFRQEVAVARAPDTPFRPGALVGVAADGSQREVRPANRGVLLYVSAHCRYCRAELVAWSRLLSGDPEATPPFVVLAPDTNPSDVVDLLTPFGDRWVSDPSGAVGRALRVRSVPYFAVLDSDGVVVEAGVGLSDPERRGRLARVSR